jgi:hypothetical protein
MCRKSANSRSFGEANPGFGSRVSGTPSAAGGAARTGNRPASTAVAASQGRYGRLPRQRQGLNVTYQVAVIYQATEITRKCCVVLPLFLTNPSHAGTAVPAITAIRFYNSLHEEEYRGVIGTNGRIRRSPRRSVGLAGISPRPFTLAPTAITAVFTAASSPDRSGRHGCPSSRRSRAHGWPHGTCCGRWRSDPRSCTTSCTRRTAAASGRASARRQ